MTDRYVANLANVAHEGFDEETVLINFDRGTYFSLRGSAPAIWDMLQAPAALDDLLGALAVAHGGLPDDAPASVAAMLDQLCAEGCLLRTDAVAGAPPTAAAASGAFAPPLVQAFHDLDDLIAIDPVHEANKFQGWPDRPPSHEAQT
jgi:hypothetical protein